MNSTSYLLDLFDFFSPLTVFSDGTKYVYGGITDTGVTDTIFYLNCKSFEALPDSATLPLPLYGHCAIYDKDIRKLFIIGGYHGRLDENNGISSDVWYKPFNENYVLINSLKVARLDPICGFIENDAGDKMLVVAGGFNDKSLDSIEYLNIQNTTYGQWIESNTKLPSTVHSGSMIQSEDYKELKIVGGKSTSTGFSKNVFTLTFENNDIQVLASKPLTYERSDFALINEGQIVNNCA